MKEFAAGCNSSNNEAGNFIPSSGEPVLKLTCPPHTCAVSQKMLAIHQLADGVKNVVFSGKSVTEIELEPHNPDKRYKGNPLKAMRVVHRCYPRDTRLGLIGGIWRICPAAMGATCTQYDCQSRLVCARERR